MHMQRYSIHPDFLNDIPEEMALAMIDTALHLAQEQFLFHNENFCIYIRVVGALVNVHHVTVSVMVNFDTGVMLRQELIHFFADQCNIRSFADVIPVDILEVCFGHMATACMHDVLTRSSMEKVQIVMKMLQVPL